jgi:hypothetical protein
MPTNLTDVDTFTDPIQGPADADAQAAAAYNLGFQGLANRTRKLFNDLVELQGRFFGGYTKRLGVFRGRPETFTQFSFSEDDPSYAQTENDAAEYCWDITELLPRGGGNAGRIQYVRVLVNPGAARAGADRMRLELKRETYGSIGSPAITQELVGTQHDNAGAALQFIEIDLTSAGGHVINSNYVYFLVAVGGNDSATNKDRMHAIEVDITEAAV